MADYTAFVEAGTALVDLLRDHLTPEPISKRELISLCSPHESENNQLTLFLYHVEEESQSVSAGYYQVDRELQRRHYARTAVLVDELFALCCRRAAPDSLVNTECGIAPDGQSVTIRMAAATGGTDPLTAQGDEAAENAAAFIRSQAYYVTFKAGQERDIVTMVCFLE